jgi:hypothetical protein
MLYWLVTFATFRSIAVIETSVIPPKTEPHIPEHNNRHTSSPFARLVCRYFMSSIRSPECVQLVLDRAHLLEPSDRCNTGVVMLAIQKYINIAGFLDDTPYSLVDRCQAAEKMYCLHLPVNSWGIISSETSAYYLFTKLHAHTHTVVSTFAAVRISNFIPHCSKAPLNMTTLFKSSTQYDDTRQSGHSPHKTRTYCLLDTTVPTFPWVTLTLLPPVPFW